jgi:hypothetical protein
VLHDQAETLPEGLELTTQPREHPPYRRVIQGTLVERRAWRSLVPDDPLGTRISNGLSIRLVIVIHIRSREFQQRRASVTLVGEYESRGNR